MTKQSRWLALFVAVAVAPAPAVEMRTAAVVDGTYVGGTEAVRFQSADGVTDVRRD